MNAKIFTEGGEGIGFGHVTRCLALVEALKKVSFEVELVVQGDKNVEQYLAGQPFRCETWRENKNWELELANIDLAIVDSYLCSKKTLEDIAQVCFTVYVDDFKRLDYPAGIVLNGSVAAKSLNYPQDEHSHGTYLLGAEYAILRSEFWIDQPYSVAKKIKTVMLTFGGCDGRRLTEKILPLFKEEPFSAWSKIVILGRGAKHLMAVEDIKDKNTEIWTDLSAKEMRRVMQKSDLAISTGGQTLYELARVGVPTIAISAAENQDLNISHFAKGGFLIHAGDWHYQDLIQRVREALNQMSSEKERIHRSSTGRNMVDGQGALRVVKFLKERKAYEKQTSSH
ncbi:MAG: UDP-2,4-diacetamido-2,4,6-trideoxy-beta-L-altropyranose hydrolase [Candidatus Omnitrophica bacterium]|nr:UDP-2,4-diacetamido-2,4,6-trideoxy-beta-L-altropyranose hydrolase [Candidatus Omnitrophota bacterium]